MEDAKFSPILKGTTSNGRYIAIVKDKINAWYIPKNKPKTIIIELDGGYTHNYSYVTEQEAIDALNDITEIMRTYLLIKYKTLKQ